jgi:hypothetical protein
LRPVKGGRACQQDKRRWSRDKTPCDRDEARCPADTAACTADCAPRPAPKPCCPRDNGRCMADEQPCPRDDAACTADKGAGPARSRPCPSDKTVADGPRGILPREFGRPSPGDQSVTAESRPGSNEALHVPRTPTPRTRAFTRDRFVVRRPVGGQRCTRQFSR